MAKIVLENVSVDFPIYGAQHRSLRSAILKQATGGLIRREGKSKERVVVRALNDVSMTIDEGDRLGIIGHNGSGKSTLLKVLAGIYEPVTGSLLVNGRVTPLFDLMPGLDVEDTGYENIYTAGLLLGMSRDEVERHLPEIEEFCELGEYLSLPVRTYSAGMMTRLGFALVTALNPDVLLMDEGIGAGDLRFAERAAERMDQFIGRSRIMVLASHSDSMVKLICNKVALMLEGSVIAIGPVEEILEKYHLLVHGVPSATVVSGATIEKVEEAKKPFVPAAITAGIANADFGQGSNQPSCFNAASLERHDGVKADRFDIGDLIHIRIRYTVKTPLYGLQLVVTIRQNGEEITQSFDTDDSELCSQSPGVFEKILVVDRMFLKAGEYSLSLSCGTLTELHDVYPDVLTFTVLADSIGTQFKSYREGRLGKVIFQGAWQDTQSKPFAQELAIQRD
jgi:ABC-type polysaccharide/polyol phosphate transport system ATPase subunit